MIESMSVNPVISTSIASTISEARHSTSSASNRCNSRPPANFTPGASPTNRRQLKGNTPPQGVQGSPCRGLGCPQIPLFFSFWLGAEGSKPEREGVFKGHRPLDPLKLTPMGDTPRQGLGTCVPLHPLWVVTLNASYRLLLLT